MRFNERGPEGLINGKAPGEHSRLNDQQRAALAQAIERGRHPISTALFAGVSVIWGNGFGRSFAFL